MQVLIVLAHPKSDSFNAAVCKALVEGLRQAGHSAEVADLYAEGFVPSLNGAELETLGTGPPAKDVARYQERILAAQALAFIFPVWWFGPPAILKGFIDRVFQENWAYRFKASGLVEGLLPHDKALVVSSAGASAKLYKLFRFGKPMRKTFDEWTLKVCGIRQIKHVTFHDVVVTDDKTRATYLKEVERLGRTYFKP
jgi:NAD(P)H dehydrogenase (quinone)